MVEQWSSSPNIFIPVDVSVKLTTLNRRMGQAGEMAQVDWFTHDLDHSCLSIESDQSSSCAHLLHSFARVPLIARADDSSNFSGPWFHCYLPRFFSLHTDGLCQSVCRLLRGGGHLCRGLLSPWIHRGFTSIPFAQGEWIATARCFLFFVRDLRTKRFSSLDRPEESLRLSWFLVAFNVVGIIMVFFVWSCNLKNGKRERRNWIDEKIKQDVLIGWTQSTLNYF